MSLTQSLPRCNSVAGGSHRLSLEMLLRLRLLGASQRGSPLAPLPFPGSAETEAKGSSRRNTVPSAEVFSTVTSPP